MAICFVLGKRRAAELPVPLCITRIQWGFQGFSGKRPGSIRSCAAFAGLGVGAAQRETPPVGAHEKWHTTGGAIAEDGARVQTGCKEISALTA